MLGLKLIHVCKKGPRDEYIPHKTVPAHVITLALKKAVKLNHSLTHSLLPKSQLVSLDIKKKCSGYHFCPLAFQAEGVLLLPASVHPCVRLSVCLSVRKLYLVRMITHHRFELVSTNLHQTCILGYSQLVLEMEIIDLELQYHFGHFDLEF